MKKICFIVDRYDPIIGGTEKLCQQILEFIKNKNNNCEVSVITHPFHQRNKFSYQYKIFDAPAKYFFMMQDHFEIMKYDAAIFFSDLHSPYLNLYDTSWCKKNLCVLNIDENTYNWKDHFYLATKNLKKFDKVITFSKNGIANRFLEENNIKGTYIPNFSRDVLQTKNDINYLQKLSLNNGNKTILYNAGFEDRKNQLYIIERIKESKILQNYNWIFIGNSNDPKYLGNCITMATDNNLKNVKFLNATNDFTKIDKIYQQIDCLVLASKAEGMPLVILEAMSAGKGVVSTPVGAVPGVLSNTDISILKSIDYTFNDLEMCLEKQLNNTKNNFREKWYNEFRKDVVCQKYNEIIMGMI